MTQTAIPYLFMRGGSSRGPYFKRSDLPEDLDQLSKVLISVVGAGHPRNIDGIGGGTAVTTKVVMLSKSEEEGVDIDYFFAQVAVEEELVDYGPTCGNMLTGVGPAAIEMGLMEPSGPETKIRIRAVNTGGLIEAIVQTPNGAVDYSGDFAIDGVPGTAAPIALSFMDTVGSKCGSLLPTGNVIDTIDGIEVTCMDVSMPMMIARAEDFGVTGYETAEELDANKEFYAKVEPIRIKAGELMGLGDVTKSVTPKIGLVSAPRNGGHLGVRYFMPWACHPTLAVTGSQCLAACLLAPGTVADGVGTKLTGSPVTVLLEHPMGISDVLVNHTNDENGFMIESAGVVRTARLIARGEVMVPKEIYPGK